MCPADIGKRMQPAGVSVTRVLYKPTDLHQRPTPPFNIPPENLGAEMSPPFFVTRPRIGCFPGEQLLGICLKSIVFHNIILSKAKYMTSRGIWKYNIVGSLWLV